MAAGDDHIPAAFDYASRYVDVRGTRMHYVEAGTGAPVVFLHGNPTWAYVWRNVIPHVAPHARCVAPDLVGMGRSGRPDSGYRFFDHYAYVAAFLERLGLERATLVGHDWGSALALHHLARAPDDVRALVLLEAILGPARWADFPPRFRLGFRLMRMPFVGWVIVSLLNGFVEQVLPRAVVRPLTGAEMDHYRAPFPTVASRRPVRQWPREIPIEGRPADVTAAARAYNRRLRDSPVPKLLLHGRPGGIIREREVAWCRAHLANLEVVDVGPGIHYLQEDNPHAIGRAIADWYRRLPD